MKKYLFLLCAVGCFQTFDLSARDVLLEAQGAYYYPTNHKFRDIYSGSGMGGLEFSVQAWRGLYAWMSGNVLVKSGHSIGLGDRTRINFIPAGVGLKYLWKVDFVDLYLGAGALPTYLHLHNHSRYVVQKSSQWGCGGIAKVGALFNFGKSYFIDVFTNYSYIKVPNHDHRHGSIYPYSSNLSGLAFGLGIGYRP